MRSLCSPGRCGRSFSEFTRNRTLALTLIAIFLLPPASARAEDKALRESALSEATGLRFEHESDPVAAEGLSLWMERSGTRRTEAREPLRAYAEALTRCWEIVSSLRRQQRQGSDLDFQLLIELYSENHSLGDAHAGVVEAFEKQRSELVEVENGAVFVERHEAALRDHVASYTTLSALLTELRASAGERESREQTLELLDAYFAGHPVSPVADPPTPAEPLDISPVPPAQTLDIAEEGISAQGFALPQSEPVVIPQNVPTAGDLGETVEVVFTPEIMTLSQQLEESPLRIFNHVRATIGFDAYTGSRRGAAETLRLRAGNDMDQASLLIALLRASGIPARYATGMVEMTPAAAMNWLGLDDASSAGSLLTTAGMEGILITDGTEAASIHCRRVWVEAYVPYSDYRGAGAGEGEALWVPLDPAFKPYENRFGTDPVEESGFNAGPFLDSYFASMDSSTVVERFSAEMTGVLAGLDPPVSLGDNRMIRSIDAPELPWLPASLPNQLLSRDESWAEVPPTRRFSLAFEISGEGAALTHQLSLPAIAGKQVTLSYIGATQPDRDAINAAGGVIGNSQPWLIQVVPQLRVDGSVVATGPGGAVLGKPQTSEISFTSPSPDSTTETISNVIIAGNYEGLAFSTGRVQVPVGNPDLACPEDFTGAFLHRLGMIYLESNDDADREIADTLQAAIYKNVDNAILSQQIKVAYSGSTPLTFEYGGLLVDADRTSGTPFSVYGHDNLLTFARIRGAQGSQNENLVFERNLGKESVSTIKILTVAHALGIPVFNITPENGGVLFPQLNHPGSVMNEIAAHLNSGDHVIIPRDPLAYFDWHGTGYINFRPNTGAGGYIIAGGLSGGATAKDEEDPPGCEQVVSVDIQPPAPNNTYSTCLTTPIKIIVRLQGYDKDCKSLSNRTVERTINPSSTSPGSYDFEFGSIGDCGICSIRTVTIIIEDGAVKFTDSNGRKPAGELLEIVPSGSEVINADAPNGAPTTQWTASGPVTPTMATGKHAMFSVTETPAPFLNFKYLLADPPMARIEATNLAETCGTLVNVYSFPSAKREFKFTVTGGPSEDNVADLQQLAAIFKYLQGLREIGSGLATFAKAVHSPIVPPEPYFEGGVSFSDSFKEDPASNRVEYSLAFGLFAEAGLKGEFTVGTGFLGVPPPLAEVAVFFPYKGAIGSTLGGEVSFKRPGDWTKSKLVDRRVFGVIVVGVGVKASIAAGFVQVSMAGSTQLKLEGGVSLNVQGKVLDLGGEAQLIIGGLEVAYEASAGWGIWSTASTWEVLAPWKFPDPDPYRLSVFTLTAP